MWLTLTHYLFFYRKSYKSSYNSNFRTQVVNPKYQKGDVNLLYELTTLRIIYLPDVSLFFYLPDKFQMSFYVLLQCSKQQVTNLWCQYSHSLSENVQLNKLMHLPLAKELSS